MTAADHRRLTLEERIEAFNFVWKYPKSLLSRYRSLYREVFRDLPRFCPEDSEVFKRKVMRAALNRASLHMKLLRFGVGWSKPISSKIYSCPPPGMLGGGRRGKGGMFLRTIRDGSERHGLTQTYWPCGRARFCPFCAVERVRQLQRRWLELLQKERPHSGNWRVSAYTSREQFAAETACGAILISRQFFGERRFRKPENVSAAVVWNFLSPDIADGWWNVEQRILLLHDLESCPRPLKWKTDLYDRVATESFTVKQVKALNRRLAAFPPTLFSVASARRNAELQSVWDSAMTSNDSVILRAFELHETYGYLRQDSEEVVQKRATAQSNRRNKYISRKERKQREQEDS